jgi:HD-GYP domain-containing protein (c-di-GMP phosphodiesterase class II)
VVLHGDGIDVEEAMQIADRRLYQAKHGGRASAGAQSRDVLLRALIERSPDLEAHASDVGALAEAVAVHLGLSEAEIEEVRHAAQLHDVGKVAVPDAILRKPGPLTAQEWEFIRQHTIIGERILAAAPSLTGVAKLVRSSHERWDGGGYPDALAGEQIPLGARIVAVADAYDAMVTDRPYRKASTPAEALDELRACAGSQFDPRVVYAFCDALRTAPQRTLTAIRFE